ncbi:MAG: hypothetical protein Q7J12_07565, partial [Syntrophales bacterium]|nr:hypothetical protein [Syntrophales bacterium]
MKPEEREKNKMDYRRLLGLIKGLASDRDRGRKWGLGLVAVLIMGLFASFLVLSRNVGGGYVEYAAKGSPGPVNFSHLSHTRGEKAKYKCEDCHDKLFNTEKHTGFLIQLFKDSDKVVKIGKESHRVLMVPAGMDGQAGKMVEVARAESLCA